MADLVKSVLGGAWSLVIGWILPAFLSLQLATIFILPDLRNLSRVDDFLDQSVVSREATLLAASAVIGLVMAAAQAPLYKILEGYMLWPRKLADLRIQAHKQRRKIIVKKQATAAAAGRGVYAGLLYGQAARYPAKDTQFAPTALGNAIRRFETYAGDRYQLDSQLLWHHLTAAAPDRAVAAVDNARANVDFFVSLLYGTLLVAIFGLGVEISASGSIRTLVVTLALFFIAGACYRLSVLLTDEWDAAVRALVDHGRIGVAAAFGLTPPKDFTQERYMWRAINTLVRRPYTYSEDHNVAGILTQFRAMRSDGNIDMNRPLDLEHDSQQAIRDTPSAESQMFVIHDSDPEARADLASRDGDSRDRDDIAQSDQTPGRDARDSSA